VGILSRLIQQFMSEQGGVRYSKLEGNSQYSQTISELGKYLQIINN